jgi:hypothetical protein
MNVSVIGSGSRSGGKSGGMSGRLRARGSRSNGIRTG